MLPSPRTPSTKHGKDFEVIIDNLNEQFALDIPNPRLFSPSGLGRDEDSPRWRVYHGLRRLYWKQNVDFSRIINGFEEWVISESTTTTTAKGTRRARWAYDEGRADVSSKEQDERLRYLNKMLDDELYLASNGSFPSYVRADELTTESLCRTRKRRFSDDDDFHTAPTSPAKGPCVETSPSAADRLQELTVNAIEPDLLDSGYLSKGPKSAPPAKGTSRFIERLMAQGVSSRAHASVTSTPRHDLSFASTRTASTANTTSFNDTSRMDTSFNTTLTDITEPMEDSESYYGSSIAGDMLTQDLTSILDGPKTPPVEDSVACSDEGEIINQLIHHGPFSAEYSLPRDMPLRCRYELERIGRACGIPLDDMPTIDSVSCRTRELFWQWVDEHIRHDKTPLPEQSGMRAWDAAVGNFQTDKHSEVVVLTGDLDWCGPKEPGILKMKLNPLKTDKTCRFHRRFGSDRFLTLTMPAPEQPGPHLRLAQHTTLHETMAMWLTQCEHKCLGRTWKPFFVEEVKTKSKTRGKIPELRFRVDFFAVDGIDFDHNSPVPPIEAPAAQPSDKHTPMSLEALTNWHLPPGPNENQSNCKLFQRWSLGLSKTFPTVVLQPKQVFHLPDQDPVMDDGCALMSRGMANKVCDMLGITGSTPSVFQGRIAGAKGLWMVDKHDSHVSKAEVWIQITDSQLKIHPHPAKWPELDDPEKLTFEVVKWSKPLNPVSLNIQLLSILEHGGPVKHRIAELARAGVQSLARDFTEVLRKDCPFLCRGLIQKMKPLGEESSALLSLKAKRMAEWMANDAECVIRLCEAGFKPRSFHHLYQRLRKCLVTLLERYKDEMHIEVPLSTYAFCIADPYGVLKENEVHFGFSSNWRDPDGQFEDNLLDGCDVLVARVPAHVPSDIQRVRAVWKPELRHFKDVIVFPTTGQVPLASLLSGGDYDGDTPWVCWDQEIVQNFRNSKPPREYPPDHFGLTKHAVPMKEIHSVDEFLQSAFTFNLQLSNLGRCTAEHERLAYDESINSPKAKELASLLSHLVDGRKGGVHLSKEAWRQYRKLISPRARALPAYKKSNRSPNLRNIVDYLQFEVVGKEYRYVLTQLEREFPALNGDIPYDRDLQQPWIEAQEYAKADKHQGGTLSAALKEIQTKVDGLYRQWGESFKEDPTNATGSFPIAALETAERARALPPPEGDHPLIQVWQHRREAWVQLLASYAYKKSPLAKFTMHAFGDALCAIKASRMPARLVANDMLVCYRVNQKVIARLTAMDGTADDISEAEKDEYEGQEAIETMVLYGSQGGAGGYFDRMIG